MADHSNIRCMRCEAPIPFSPGAGSRLCPFCGTINLSREQEIAAPPLELKIDEIFRLLQLGQQKSALEQAERMMQSITDNYRLAFYRASILLDMGRNEDAIFALIDLGGMDGPSALRADGQAKLAEALLASQRVEEAQQAAERCLELMDGHPPGCYMLARTLMEKGQNDQALRLLKDTISRLDRTWRITLPIRPTMYRLLMARIQEHQNKPQESIDTLQDLLLQNPSTAINTVARATRMLGLALLKQKDKEPAAQDLLTQASMLDPENRLKLLDALKQACEVNGVDMASALEEFREQRAKLLREIQSALATDDEQGARPEQLTPEMDLTLIHQDADLRCDRLERAALRLNLPRFDRGTLYPLRNIEDFRRWVAAWRLRMRLLALRQAWAKSNRLHGLHQAHEKIKKTNPGSRKKPLKRSNKRPPWTHWVIAILSLGILAMLTFFFMAGDRYLDQFKGKLVKIECAEDGTACALAVATGQAGMKRYKEAKEFPNAPEGWWKQWQHGHIEADGLLHYSLSFAWGDLDAKRYQPCLGKPIAKLPFTLSPLCGLLDEETPID